MRSINDSPPAEPMVSPRKCVLLVEDEMLIRMMLSDELRDAGYDVIEAFNADEVLTILTSLVQVDIVLSDVRMPGSMDGLGLLDALQTRRPVLPVVLMSGHLEACEALFRGAKKFLHKPFRFGEAAEAVRNELTGASMTPEPPKGSTPTPS